MFWADDEMLDVDISSRCDLVDVEDADFALINLAVVEVVDDMS